MSTQTVRWLPSTAPNIVAYQLLYSDVADAGPYLALATIVNMQSGPNWDSTLNCFFYVDAEVPYRRYRLHTVDVTGQVFGDETAAPFHANNTPSRVPVANVYPMTHDTGGANALQYVDPNGAPIADATVRVYTKTAWDSKQYSLVVGLTKTDANGKWVQPVMVEPGNTFVVHYTLANRFGPDTVEITV